MPETVLITGASGGIGLDLAREFARHGYNLILAARNVDRLQEIAAELRDTGVRVEVIARDLANAQAAAGLLREIRERGLVVNILVNNAGFGLHGKFAELAVAEQVGMIQLNVTTLVALTRLLLPGMLERKHGRILNVASTAAFQPGPFMAVYYASKSFVLSFSEALAEELRGSGVTVTALCPGPTRTGFGERSGMDKTALFQAAAVMDSAPVARAGFEGCVRGKRLVIPGMMNSLGALGTRLMPRALLTRVIGKMQRAR